MVSTTLAREPVEALPGHKGLKRNAIGFASDLVIAVASVAPAYSLAATLGLIVAVKGVGTSSPAILLVSFIPMLLIAAAYKYMNLADPDCGTTFAWGTRALGPRTGWLGGWGIVIADIIVMATLAEIAGQYTFRLFYWSSAASSKPAWIALGVVWIVVMTWICYAGIELSARTQRILLSTEVATLAIFSVVALVKVYANHPAHSIEPAFSWFDPFQVKSFSTMIDGVLLGLFIYWGWDSGVSVNEETEDSARAPGSAAVLSTILLLLIYVVVSAASQAFAGTAALSSNSSDVLGFLGHRVFPKPLDLLVIIAVLTSASASTQTTILPTARTTLSMARWGAIPKVFGKVHPKHQTPHVSTITMGVLSIIWFIPLAILSTNVLGDSITALGFMIAFYYGLTGFICAVYYRRELLKSLRNLVFVGLAPLAGGVIMLLIFIKAMIFYGHRANNYSPDIFGLGTPDFIGILALGLGGVLLIVTNFSLPEFFRRRPEVADPAVLAAGPRPVGQTRSQA